MKSSKKLSFFLFLSLNLSPLYGIEPSQVLDALQNNPLATAAGGGAVGGLATTGTVVGAASLGYAAKKSYEHYKNKKETEKEIYKAHKNLTKKENLVSLSQKSPHHEFLEKTIKKFEENPNPKAKSFVTFLQNIHFVKNDQGKKIYSKDSNTIEMFSSPENKKKFENFQNFSKKKSEERQVIIQNEGDKEDQKVYQSIHDHLNFIENQDLKETVKAPRRPSKSAR